MQTAAASQCVDWYNCLICILSEFLYLNQLLGNMQSGLIEVKFRGCLLEIVSAQLNYSSNIFFYHNEHMWKIKINVKLPYVNFEHIKSECVKSLKKKLKTGYCNTFCRDCGWVLYRKQPR